MTEIYIVGQFAGRIPLILHSNREELRIMIHELRIYTCFPGKTPDFLKLVEEVGKPIRGDRHGKNLGYWTSEFGELNQIYHMWEYDDLAHRDKVRAELGKLDSWRNDYVANVRPLIQRQDVKFLHPQVPVKAPQGDGHIYELRQYQIKTGHAAEWLGHFKSIMPVREKYSMNVGFWATEVPTPNNVLHMWVYDSLQQRTETRAKVDKDTEWHGFRAKAGHLLQNMNSVILMPAKVSAMR